MGKPAPRAPPLDPPLQCCWFSFPRFFPPSEMRSGYENRLKLMWLLRPIFQFIYFILLYRHECFTGKYTTRKIHKNYIRDTSGLFSIISHVSLSMISLISSLSLKLYLNSLVYHRNVCGSSSKIFGNLRTS